MTSLFDQLEQQLRAAAQERVAARPRAGRRRRARAWLGASARAVPVVVALATTIAVVAVALVLLHHSSSPAPGPAPGGGGSAGLPAFGTARSRRELGYMQRATAAAIRSQACTTRPPQQAAAIHGTPDAALRSTLAVLRRPAGPQDHLSPQALEGITGVYPGAARLARVTGGVAYYLVPVRTDPAAGQPTSQCFTAQQAALRRALPQIPAALRTQTLALQTELIAFERRQISAPPQGAVCFITRRRDGGGSSCALTPAQIRHGIGGLQESQSTYTDVVPDGVATVTLRFRALGTRPAHTVSSSVVGNVFVAPDPGPSGAVPAQPSAVIWRAADGRVLHRFVAPTSIAAICRRRLAACLALYGGGEEQASSSSATTANAAPAHPSS